MRNLAILMFLVAAASAGPSLAAQNAAPASAAMTNDDVVKMVAAGLSDQIVIAAIRQANARNFDLSPAVLIDLKAKRVSDAVVAAMLSPGAPPSAGPSGFQPPGFGTPTANSDDPLVAHAPGFYLDAGEGRTPRLQPLGTPQITNLRSGGGAALALTGGLFGSKNMNYRVRGETASIRAPTDAVFYYYALGVYGANADGVMLLRLQKKGREREYTFARAGGPGGIRGAEGDVELTVEKVAEGTYRLTPKSPLAPGEYGLAESTGVGGPGAVYDFGVDGPQKK